MCVWVCGVFVMYLGASAKSNTIISFNFQCHLNRRRKSFLINFLLHKGVENLQQIAVQKICVFPLSLSRHTTTVVEIFFSFPADMSRILLQLLHGRIWFPVEREREKNHPTREGWVKVFFTFSHNFQIFPSQLDLLPSPPTLIHAR